MVLSAHCRVAHDFTPSQQISIKHWIYNGLSVPHLKPETRGALSFRFTSIFIHTYIHIQILEALCISDLGIFVCRDISIYIIIMRYLGKGAQISTRSSPSFHIHLLYIAWRSLRTVLSVHLCCAWEPTHRSGVESSTRALCRCSKSFTWWSILVRDAQPLLWHSKPLKMHNAYFFRSLNIRKHSSCTQISFQKLSLEHEVLVSLKFPFTLLFLQAQIQGTGKL